MLLLGDCNHWLKEIKDNSIDLIVTDPPYGIEFMGKDWDKALVQKETWKECYRVLKEGKLAFVMCSPRQDVLSRMIINLQDAGFRTNYTSIYWTYSQGFPKAANVSKLLDKKNGRTPNQEFRDYLRSKLGNGKTVTGLDKLLQQRNLISPKTAMRSHYFSNNTEPRLPSVIIYKTMKEYLDLDNRFDEFIAREEAEREIIGKGECGDPAAWYAGNQSKKLEYDITKPATEAAKKMEGAYVGFQPKPAVEVILVVSKGKTLTWLDDCRIPYQSEDDKDIRPNLEVTTSEDQYGYTDHKRGLGNEKGRFPANLLVSDDCLNDGKITKSGGHFPKVTGDMKNDSLYKGGHKIRSQTERYLNDEGSYSRYFSLDAWADKTFPFIITPKASRSERNKGCEDLPEKTMTHYINMKCANCGLRMLSGTNPSCKCKIKAEVGHSTKNHHPTVKPLKLMSYLITMGSREGDLVLDPFCGSGTVCIAADQLHRKWIGIEKNEEYAAIIKKRLMVPLSQLKLTVFE